MDVWMDAERVIRILKSVDSKTFETNIDEESRFNNYLLRPEKESHMTLNLINL